MSEEERSDIYLDTDTIIDLAKVQLGISLDSTMTDEEIGNVMKFLASDAPGTIEVDGKPVFGRIGIALMLSLTLYEFPKFYERYELWQIN